MNTRKLTLCLPLLMGLVIPFSLNAQTILTLPATGTTGSGMTLVNFQFRLDGSIVEEGAPFSTTLTNSDLTYPTRFIWDPTLCVLRAGWGSSSENISNIGMFSVAFGTQSTASGNSGFAAGVMDNAAGTGAAAFGIGATAEYAALASGYFTFASGNEAAAFGQNTNATAANSTALGYFTKANSYNCLVVGSYNVGHSEGGGTPSLNTSIPADPLFELGNGTGTGITPNTDALVVYKDGDAVLSGTLTVAPGGDIPMFNGN